MKENETLLHDVNSSLHSLEALADSHIRSQDFVLYHLEVLVRTELMGNNSPLHL